MTKPINTVEAHLADAEKKCRDVLASQLYRELDAQLPAAPKNSEGWFELLSGYPQDPTCLETLKRLQADLANKAIADEVKLGHYAIIKALPSALARIRSELLPNTVKRHYAIFCREVAARERHWEQLYDFENAPPLFRELSEFATLRTFPLGDVSLGFGKMPLVQVASTVHPLSLPGFLCEVICAMRGGGMTVFPHINYGRKSIIMRREEYERHLWLMAKALELRPECVGLSSISWLHSLVVGEVYPHLAWMRDVFIEAGAYLVETRPSPLGRFGFGYNNPKRVKLYEQGKFCPRRTMVLWPRDDFLEWAANHPELAPEGETHIARPQPRGLRIRMKPAKPAAQTKRNSPIRLWDGHALYSRFGKLSYAVLTLLLPALTMMGIATYALGWSAAIPGFLMGTVAAHAVQYFFSQ